MRDPNSAGTPRQTDQVWYHHRLQVSSLAVDLQWCYWPLQERSFTSVQMLHTGDTHTHKHTHTPGRSRVNPERQQEEKSGHQRRTNGQNSAGGEGNKRTSRTNLHRETDLTSTEHTPKPHDTLQRGTGENKGPNGELVGEEERINKVVKRDSAPTYRVVRFPSKGW